jgi:hypothetical protein
MTIHEIADYIIDIHDTIKTLQPEAVMPTVEGAMFTLIQHKLSDWTIYKIYCEWLGLDTLNEQVVKDFTKIYNRLEEGVHEQRRTDAHA